MKRFLTVAVAMLALTGMGQVAMRKLEDLTNTNLVCVTDYGPQVLSLTQRVVGLEGSSNDWTKTVTNLASLSNNVASLSSRVDATNNLFSAWFSGLQSRTSYWNTAYSWGDWSAAVGANTAAIRILETNTVTRADTNGWETGSHAGLATTGDVAQAIAEITAESIGALTNETDLAALRAYHYGSPDIVESPAEWFQFDSGTMTGFNWWEGRENVVIPWAVGGVPVTTIGDGAFRVRGIVSVIAPQTVTTIGNSAFYNCHSLASVSLPQATAIGDYAFNSCYSLASVSLPQATAIGDEAFIGCYLLTSINLPQATAIGDGAFNSCYSLASVSLPQVTAIGNEAFYSCAMLTSVRMGQNAPTEATDVFYGITPPPTVYVTNPQATGWGAVWNGAPVVRPPLYADAIHQAGELVATTGHVAQAIAEIPTPDLSAKVDVTAGIATNLTARGWFALPQSEATNLVLRLVSSNEHIIVQEVYQ